MTGSPSFNIVFGAGPLGIAVAEQLVQDGCSVKLATRSGNGRGLAYPTIKFDLLSDTGPSIALRAQTIFLCSAPLYTRWVEELVPMVEGAICLAESSGAALVFADNLYAYGLTSGPLTENMLCSPNGPKGEARQRAAENLLTAHATGRIRAAIVRSSDFYGPRVEESLLGLRVFHAISAGKPANCLGNIDAPHTFTYIRDFARALITVARYTDCLGQIWHAPSAEPQTVRHMIELIALEARAKLRLRVAPQWLMKFVGLFDPKVRELSEIYYQFTEPFIMDSTKYESRFGDQPTPPEQAVHETLAHMGIIPQPTYVLT